MTRNWQTIGWLMAMPGLALLTGCADMMDDSNTAQMWTDRPTQHYRPAPRGEIKVFQARGSDDLLVQYVEKREKTGSEHERVYYLLANRDLVRGNRKPKFGSLRDERGLDPLPVQVEGGPDLSAPLWAQQAVEGDGFRLVRNGVPGDWYQLPVYVDKRDQMERTLLTPFTVMEDVGGNVLVVAVIVVVVGGLVFLSFYASNQVK